MEKTNLAAMIDHTLLSADATSADIKELCAQAREYKFATVCIHPIWVPLAAQILKDSSVGVCTVVGFPFGTNTTESKASEARQALALGADEIDMVIAIGKLKEKEHIYVREDISRVVEIANDYPVKVIIEATLLTPEEIVQACSLAVAAGASFVKTSTGFSGGGATVEDVQLMKKTVAKRAQVKASGGIRTKEQALVMVRAGATRIGTSRGTTIIK